MGRSENSALRQGNQPITSQPQYKPYLYKQPQHDVAYRTAPLLKSVSHADEPVDSLYVQILLTCEFRMNEHIVVVLVLIVCICLASGQHECPAGTYLDTRTGRCDSCSEICQFADIQGTVEDCRKHCPDYGRDLPPKIEPRCPPGQYYDDALSHCDTCRSICDNHQEQGTTEACKEKCPNEFKKNEETIRKNVMPPQDKSYSISSGLIIGITGLMALVAVASVVLVVVYRDRLPHTVQQRLPCLRRHYALATTSTTSSGEDVRLPIEESGQHVQEEGFAETQSSVRSSYWGQDT